MRVYKVCLMTVKLLNHQPLCNLTIVYIIWPYLEIIKTMGVLLTNQLNIHSAVADSISYSNFT